MQVLFDDFPLSFNIMLGTSSNTHSSGSLFLLFSHCKNIQPFFVHWTFGFFPSFSNTGNDTTNIVAHEPLYTRIFFFFKKRPLFFLINFIFKLYIIVLVLPNIKMNPSQVYIKMYQHQKYTIDRLFFRKVLKDCNNQWKKQISIEEWRRQRI